MSNPSNVYGQLLSGYLVNRKRSQLEKQKTTPTLDVSKSPLPDALTPRVLAESLDRFLDC
jgi:hypothetical protein